MKEYMLLKDHVYNYISEKINNGDLNPDDKIGEAQIVEALNISRTPVREALIQLASDGYLESLPRKGFKVKRINEKNAIEIYNIIGPLDGRAAYLSLKNITNEDIKQMQFLFDSMRSAIDIGLYEKYYTLQLEFHNIYTLKCGNEQLILFLSKMKKNFMRKFYTADDNENLEEVLRCTNEEHGEILRLFRENDGVGLQNYIRDIHWDDKKSKFDTW